MSFVLVPPEIDFAPKHEDLILYNWSIIAITSRLILFSPCPRFCTVCVGNGDRSSHDSPRLSADFVKNLRASPGLTWKWKIFIWKSASETISRASGVNSVVVANECSLWPSRKARNYYLQGWWYSERRILSIQELRMCEYLCTFFRLDCNLHAKTR